MVAIRFMVGSRTDTTRGIPSARSIEIARDPTSRLPGQTSNFANVLKTAAGEIQADNTKTNGLFGDPSPKSTTKASSGLDNTRSKQPNPTLDRTDHGVLRPLPHTGSLHVRSLHT
jgi:hypothetical protein